MVVRMGSVRAAPPVQHIAGKGHALGWWPVGRIPVVESHLGQTLVAFGKCERRGCFGGPFLPDLQQLVEKRFGAPELVRDDRSVFCTETVWECGCFGTASLTSLRAWPVWSQTSCDLGAIRRAAIFQERHLLNGAADGHCWIDGQGTWREWSAVVVEVGFASWVSTRWRERSCVRIGSGLKSGPVSNQ